MHNIATIYRFNTPFLDISGEKKNLVDVVKKIEKSLEFDGIIFEKGKEKEGNFYKISLNFSDDLGKIEFFYISNIGKVVYHLPIFKLNIFINNKFLINNSSKEKAVKFINNIFECFDGLNEKEFLIDINNDFYYKKGFFSSKIRPNYDFSDIDKARKLFENKGGIKIIEDFIKNFSNKEFVLTKDKSDYYHTLHGIFLYFIYLVFIMYQNISNASNAKKELKDVVSNGLYEDQAILIEKRLSYVEEVHSKTFEQYRNRLELFFKMF